MNSSFPSPVSRARHDVSSRLLLLLNEVCMNRIYQMFGPRLQNKEHVRGRRNDPDQANEASDCRARPELAGPEFRNLL